MDDRVLDQSDETDEWLDALDSVEAFEGIVFPGHSSILTVGSVRESPLVVDGKVEVRPLVKVTPLEAPTGARVRRLGFMSGQISVPDDFDRLGADEIERLFGGAE